MTDEFMPDEPENLSYEDIEDAAWTGGDDLDVIDLDKLDDAIDAEDEAQPDKATEGLFKTIETLGGEIAPPKTRLPARKSERASVPPPAQAEEVQPPPSAPTPAPAEAETPPPTKPEKASRARSPKGHPRKARQAAAAPAPVTEAPEPAAVAGTPEPAAVAGTPESAAVAEAVPAAAEPPPPPDLIYRLQINLPPELIEQVHALRKTGEISALPEPGIALVAGFRAPDPDAVKGALAAWVQKHLPMQLETAGVCAEVIGTQQYVAAWTLQPEKEIRAAQRSLNKILAPLSTPLPDTPAEFPVRVVIGDQIAASRYPLVIAQMQRDFEPEVWHATELRLFQHPTDAAPEAWDVAATFD